MRPVTILLGILLGSAVSISFSLATVWVVFLALSGRHPELRLEMPRLAASFAIFLSLTGASAVSFIAQLRHRPWRWWAHAATGAVIASICYLYWPRPLG
jgi:hypothetical protein